MYYIVTLFFMDTCENGITQNVEGEYNLFLFICLERASHEIEAGL